MRGIYILENLSQAARAHLPFVLENVALKISSNRRQPARQRPDLNSIRACHHLATTFVLASYQIRSLLPCLESRWTAGKRDGSRIMKMGYVFLLLIKFAKFIAASFIHVLNGCMAHAVKGLTPDLCRGKLV